MATVLYYSGTDRVFNVRPMENAAFAAAFPGIKGQRYDGYQKLVGFDEGPDVCLPDRQSWSRDLYIGAKPVTRVIYRPANPSNHKCGARCRHAKGSSCECSCGGQFHGAGG
jgi:hypothetical protein